MDLFLVTSFVFIAFEGSTFSRGFICSSVLFLFEFDSRKLYFIFQVHNGVCIGCSQKFETKSGLFDHLHDANHTTALPDMSVWDQPQ